MVAYVVDRGGTVQITSPAPATTVSSGSWDDYIPSFSDEPSDGKAALAVLTDLDDAVPARNSHAVSVCIRIQLTTLAEKTAASAMYDKTAAFSLQSENAYWSVWNSDF